MNKSAFFITIILILLLLSACGSGTPEQQARLMYEYEQRYSAEIQRLERGELPEKSNNPLFSYIIILTIGIGIGWSIKTYRISSENPEIHCQFE